MDSDVSPALLEAIQTAFDAGYDNSDLIGRLLGKVESGEATYEEASLFAETVGDLLAECYGQCLSSNALPDGRMYYNIGKKVVEPTLKNNYELVADYSGQVQTALNQKAGISIQAQKPALNQNRIDGIINRLDEAKQFDDVAWILEEPVTNFSMAVVDDAIKANAEFQYKAGLNPIIERREVGGCCKWCRNLAGAYIYPDVPKDVYRRHENCRCRAEYDPKNGKRQNVHSKQWRDTSESDIIREKAKRLEQEQEIKKILGLKSQATVSVPAKAIDIDALEFDAEHIQDEKGRDISEPEAKGWIKNAVFSANVWDGTYERYFSEDGAVYVNLKGNYIRTAFPREKYDESIIKSMEVIKKW